MPKIQEMLDKIPSPLSGAACNEKTGWLPPNFDDNCRELLSETIIELMSLEPPETSAPEEGAAAPATENNEQDKNDDEEEEKDDESIIDDDNEVGFKRTHFKNSKITTVCLLHFRKMKIYLMTTIENCQ